MTFLRTRRARLVNGAWRISFNDAPYQMEDGGWSDGKRILEVRLVVEATNLQELQDCLTNLQSMISLGRRFFETGLGRPTYIETKTCDPLEAEAEIGPTWRRKRVHGGFVIMSEYTIEPDRAVGTIALTLDTAEIWESSVLQPIGWSAFARYENNVLFTQGLSFTAQRWGPSSGITARVIWRYRGEQEITFLGVMYPLEFAADYSNGELHLRGASAVYSVPYTWVGEQIYDCLFVWDPVIQWARGYINGVLVIEGPMTLEDVVGDFVGPDNNSFEGFTGVKDDGIADTFTNWNIVAAGGRAEASAVAYEGNTSLKLVDNVRLWQKMKLVPDRDYALRAWARKNTGQIRRVDIRLWTLSDRAIATCRLMPTSANTWASRIVYFRTPRGETDYVLTIENLAYEIWVDKVEILEMPTVGDYDLCVCDRIMEIHGLQLWPTALSQAEAEEVMAWAKPELEIGYLNRGTPPSDIPDLAGDHKLVVTAGSEGAALAIMASSGASPTIDRYMIGVRVDTCRYVPSSISDVVLNDPTVLYECENSILSGGTTQVSVSNASGGKVARVTPTNTDWGTRCIIYLIDSQSRLWWYRGLWRLLLVVRDNANNVQVNQIRWRFLQHGVSLSDWIGPLWASAVNTFTYILMSKEMQDTFLPPTSWHEEIFDGGSLGNYSDLLQVEIQTRNTVGSGGGTLDLDALVLMPADRIGVIQAVLAHNNFWHLVDHTTSPFGTALVGNEIDLADLRPAVYQGLPPLVNAGLHSHNCALLKVLPVSGNQNIVVPSGTHDLKLKMRARWA